MYIENSSSCFCLEIDKLYRRATLAEVGSASSKPFLYKAQRGVYNITVSGFLNENRTEYIF